MQGKSYKEREKRKSQLIEDNYFTFSELTTEGTNDDKLILEICNGDFVQFQQISDEYPLSKVYEFYYLRQAQEFEQQQYN